MKMKRLVLFGMACTMLAGFLCAQSKPPGGFEQLTSLVGQWEGTTSSGQAAHVTYQLVSAATALLERLQSGKEPEMVTMYTADGNRVAMTHYCNAGNQPQMRTLPITRISRVFSFNFVRATNLVSPEAGHMDHLVVTLLDKDHFSQAWTWKEKGRTRTVVFKFTRKG
jgi:hypothetical protein